MDENKSISDEDPFELSNIIENLNDKEMETVLIWWDEYFYDDDFQNIQDKYINIENEKYIEDENKLKELFNNYNKEILKNLTKNIKSTIKFSMEKLLKFFKKKEDNIDETIVLYFYSFQNFEKFKELLFYEIGGGLDKKCTKEELFNNKNLFLKIKK